MSRRLLPIYVVLTAVLSGVAAWIISEPLDPAAALSIERVAISSSGRVIGVAASSGWIGIIDQDAPDAPQRFRGGAGKLRDLRFSSDEEWLLVQNDECSRHSVYQLGSLYPCDNPGEPQTTVDWPADRSSNAVTAAGLVVFGNAAGSIEVHDRASGKMLRRFTFR